MRQVSETTSKYTVFPALILVYTVIVTDQRKRNTFVNLGLVLGLVNLGLVNLGFSWVFDESTYPTCDRYVGTLQLVHLMQHPGGTTRNS